MGPNYWGPFVNGDQLLGDHLSMGTELVRDRLSRGPINWGPIVGDQMSGDLMCLGPNVSQPSWQVWAEIESAVNIG